VELGGQGCVELHPQLDRRRWGHVHAVLGLGGQRAVEPTADD
jgi:hypothetical protein